MAGRAAGTTSAHERSLSREETMQTLRRITPLSCALLLLAAACDSPTEPKLLGVPALTLEAIGDAAQLVATVNGTQPLPEWESLHPLIATVTRAGMVTAVAPGTATVVARIGSETAQGTVTVLPPVSVEINAASKQNAEQPGMESVMLRMANPAGRGFYRMRVYRELPGGELQIVSQGLTDLEIAAQQAEFTSSFDVSAPAHFVVVYSREPNSMEYRRTACTRLDGAPGCPLP
jgi:hypothetical protein